MNQKTVPREVKAIGILYIIGGIIAIILGLFPLIILLISYYSGSLIENNFPIEMLKITLTITLLILGIGILCIFIGRGLWKGHLWAKRFAIVFSIIAILQAPFTMKFGTFNYKILISLIINLYIASYLIFNKIVKEAFSNK